MSRSMTHAVGEATAPTTLAAASFPSDGSELRSRSSVSRVSAREQAEATLDSIIKTVSGNGPYSKVSAFDALQLATIGLEKGSPNGIFGIERNTGRYPTHIRDIAESPIIPIQSMEALRELIKIFPPQDLADAFAGSYSHRLATQLAKTFEGDPAHLLSILSAAYPKMQPMAALPLISSAIGSLPAATRENVLNWLTEYEQSHNEPFFTMHIEGRPPITLNVARIFSSPSIQGLALIEQGEVPIVIAGVNERNNTVELARLSYGDTMTTENLGGPKPGFIDFGGLITDYPEAISHSLRAATELPEKHLRLYFDNFARLIDSHPAVHTVTSVISRLDINEPRDRTALEETVGRLSPTTLKVLASTFASLAQRPGAMLAAGERRWRSVPTNSLVDPKDSHAFIASALSDELTARGLPDVGTTAHAPREPRSLLARHQARAPRNR